jgi:ribosome recycling factor
MPEMIMMDAEERMEHSLEALHREFTTVRSGRANPKMFERVTVDYYGVMSPINQVASITSPEGNQLYIKPFDKSLLSKLEKAVLAANLGVTPNNDGVGLRIVLPQMTEERRKEGVKLIHKMAEDNKVAIRNVRRDAISEIKKLEKDKKLSEDDSAYYQEEIQKLTDRFIIKVDAIFAEKEKEIMHI